MHPQWVLALPSRILMRSVLQPSSVEAHAFIGGQCGQKNFPEIRDHGLARPRTRISPLGCSNAWPKVGCLRGARQGERGQAHGSGAALGPSSDFHPSTDEQGSDDGPSSLPRSVLRSVRGHSAVACSGLPNALSVQAGYTWTVHGKKEGRPIQMNLCFVHLVESARES